MRCWTRPLPTISAGLRRQPRSVRSSKSVSIGEKVYVIGAQAGGLGTYSVGGVISGLREVEGSFLIQTEQQLRWYQLTGSDGRVYKTQALSPDDARNKVAQHIKSSSQQAEPATTPPRSGLTAPTVPTASLSPGSSGAGLFDEQGRLIGIITFDSKEGETLNFALPGEWVLALEMAKESPAKRARTASPKAESASDHLARAEEFRQAHQWEQAELEYRAALELDPSNFQSHFALAELLNWQYKKYDEAIPEYRAAIRLEPNELEPYLNLGSSLQSAGHEEEGLNELREAETRFPNELEAYLALGDYLWMVRREDDGLKEFREAVKRFPASAEAHLRLGEFLETRTPDAAIAECSEAIRLGPTLGNAHGCLGEAYYFRFCNTGAEEDYQKAVAELGTAEQLGTTNAAAERIQDLEAHKNYYVWQIARRKAVADSKTRSARGNEALQRNDFDDAISNFREVIAIDKENSILMSSDGTLLPVYAPLKDEHDRPIVLDAHIGLAHALTRKAQQLSSSAGLDEAETAYGAALKIQPTAALHIEFGKLLFSDGKLAGAIAEYQEAIRLDPRSRDADLNLGSAFAKGGDIRDALATYDSACESIRFDSEGSVCDTDSVELLVARATLEETIDRLNDAKQDLLRAVQLKPTDAELHHSLGRIFEKRYNGDHSSGFLEDAFENYQMAHSLDASNPRYGSDYERLARKLKRPIQ